MITECVILNVYSIYAAMRKIATDFFRGAQILYVKLIFDPKG